jgi:hypothetical protein
MRGPRTRGLPLRTPAVISIRLIISITNINSWSALCLWSE